METTESKEKETLKRNYGKIVLTLENAILGAEKLDDNTVSQLDGLSKETELDLRILGCELIQTSGILLKLPQVSEVNEKSKFIRAMFVAEAR
jgi:cyclin L